MSTICMIVFFLLFGILGLFSTSIPHWILPAVALLLAVILIYRGGLKKQGP